MNKIQITGSWIDSGKIVKESHLSPSKVYLLAYYWASTSFTGAGFGDITAQDSAHMILSICINIHGVLFFGWVISFVIDCCPILIRYQPFLAVTNQIIIRKACVYKSSLMYTRNHMKFVKLNLQIYGFSSNNKNISLF